MDSVSPETRSRVMAQVRSQAFTANLTLRSGVNGYFYSWMAAIGTAVLGATGGRRRTRATGMTRSAETALGMRKQRLN